jgi:hypothetical protein
MGKILKSKPDLENLIKRNDIWRASKINQDVIQGISSTYPLLDQHLYGGGWPRDGLTELLLNKLGTGELRLLTPALAKLSQEQNRWLLWVIEKALGSKSCSAVLAWPDYQFNYPSDSSKNSSKNNFKSHLKKRKKAYSKKSIFGGYKLRVKKANASVFCFETMMLQKILLLLNFEFNYRHNYL